MHIFKHTNYDFLRWRWHAIALSWVIIIAGVATIATKGIPKGVEFAGGTVVIVEFERPMSVQEVRTALDKSFPGGGQNVIVQAYGDPSLRQVMIRVAQVGTESGSGLSTTAQQVDAALAKSNIGGFHVVGTEIIGPSVGKELTTQGEIGRHFMVIVEGEAEVTRDGTQIAVLGPGSFFGEMSLLDGQPRTASPCRSAPASAWARPG